MSLLKNIYKRFGTAKTYFKKQEKREFVDPSRDWGFVLMFSVTIFVFGIMFTAFNFYMRFVSPPLEIIEDQESVIYRAKDVIIYSEIYNEKEAIFNSLRKGRSAALFQEEIITKEANDPEEPILADDVVSE